VLHVPTRLLLGWVDGVATRASAAPLGELQTPHVIALAAGLVAAVGTRGARRRAGLAVAGLAVAAAVVVAAAPAPLRSRPAAGIVRWHAAGAEVVVLGGGGWRASLGAGAALEELRRAGVEAIDVLVVADGEVGTSVVEAVVERHPTGVVLVPAASAVVGARVPADGVELAAGALRIVVVPAGERLVVDVAPPH
jgi:hypothetical protein